jgi:hypothetical protein
MKKNFDDGLDGNNGAIKLHRNQRKYRGHKLAMAIGRNRREDRSGWAYAKHRTAIA